MKRETTNTSGRRRRFQRRMRWWKWGRVAIVVMALAILSFLDQRGYLLAHADDGGAFHLRAVRVVRVIDGDTFEVEWPDEFAGTPTTRVRVWGIDCPEMARAGDAVGGSASASIPAEPFAIEATELTRSFIERRMVRLRIEPHRTRGAYGRLLAHVDVIESVEPDAATGEVHANLAEALLEAGLVRRDERWVHSMLVTYERIELRARQQRAGMWN